MAQANDLLLIGWNRAVVGREHLALELFQQVTGFWQTQQKSGNIASFEHILLQPHGGDLNGFTLVRGERARLSQVIESTEYLDIQAKAVVYLDGYGVIGGVTGEALQDRFKRYGKSVPQK
jgi:hypothetical protein